MLLKIQHNSISNNRFGINFYEMKKSELIKKWKDELELHKNVLSNPVFYTRQERLKAAAKSLTIVSMLVDIDELKTLD